jgi:phage repressor protein C with HTH and peptisase S24 domain
MTKYVKAVEDLNEGKKHTMKVFGNSMSPLIKDGSKVTFSKTDDYQIGDVVMTKVSGRWMVHKITKIGSDNRYMISNNKGHDNGWTKNIFGRVIAVNSEPFGRKVKSES